MTELLRLNIGCGNKKIDGYTSVDIDPASQADIICPATKLPLNDGCASEVMAIHLIEHLPPWEVADALKEWHRVLAKGGKLVLEQPDFMKSCRNVADCIGGRGHPDQLGMWGVFGDPRTKNPLMLHRWGYWFASLSPVVEAAGFTDCREMPTVYHSAGREKRDFRLEARKA